MKKEVRVPVSTVADIYSTVPDVQYSTCTELSFVVAPEFKVTGKPNHSLFTSPDIIFECLMSSFVYVRILVDVRREPFPFSIFVHIGFWNSTYSRSDKRTKPY
jgi:hypothetical protein